MRFENKFCLGLALVALVTIPAVSQVDCTKILGILCDQLKAAPKDSTVFEINITLKGPPNGKADSAYWVELEKNLDHLFTTYDLRDSLSQRFLTPRKMGWDINWGYGDIFATKKTIIELLKEDYVHQVVSWAGVGPATIVRSRIGRLVRPDDNGFRYFVNGRQVSRPIGSYTDLQSHLKRPNN